MTETPSPQPPQNGKRRSVGGIVVRVALAGLLVYLLWGIISAIDWGNVVDAIAGLSAADWGRLLLLTGAYFVAEALILMAALPGMRIGHGLMAFLIPTMAGTVIPGPTDLVARFAMYSRWGFSVSDTTASVMTSWVYSHGAKIALPILGAIVLAPDRSHARFQSQVARVTPPGRR